MYISTRRIKYTTLSTLVLALCFVTLVLFSDYLRDEPNNRTLDIANSIKTFQKPLINSINSIKGNKNGDTEIKEPTKAELLKLQKESETRWEKELVDILSKNRTKEPYEFESRKMDKIFYKSVFELYGKYKPKKELSRHYSDKCDRHPKKYSEEDLRKCLQLEDKELEELTELHTKLVEDLPEKFPKGLYKGDGIVIVGGDRFSMMAFLSLKTLRDSGNRLPVEILIPIQDEGDDEYCNDLLPKFNARCISVRSILDEKTIADSDFHGYQYKALALIVSSFENVLLLDADNIPVRQLDHIFKNEPFTNHGLVLWPDYWRRFTHPDYYKISGVKVGNNRIRHGKDTLTDPSRYFNKDDDPKTQIPFHDREGTVPDSTTESGQVLVSKSLHAKTILLALYYNLNGPSHYYPLLSQGTLGEGDKETYIHAANALNKPFYQLKNGPGTAGYHKPNGEGYHGSAMLQSDPVEDYALYKKVGKAISSVDTQVGAYKDLINYKYDKDAFGRAFPFKKVHLMFSHTHFPKLDPYNIWKGNALINSDGKRFRAVITSRFTFDFELKQFESMKRYLCDAKFKFKYLEDAMKKDENFDMKAICKNIEEQYEYMKETTHIR